MRIPSYFLLSALLACSLPAQVTHYQIRFVTSDPSGSCAPSYVTVNKTTGNIMGCVGGTWTAIGGSGSPTGSAGGVLAGTYPNPAFANPNAATGPVVLDAFGAANLANPGVFYVAPPGGAPTEGSTLGSDGLHTPRITVGTSAVAGTIDTYEGVPAFVPSVSTQALFLDPTTHHLRRKNNSSTIVDLETPTAANVILGFSGTCNSSSAMMGDGSCAAISSAYTAITGLSLGDTLYGSGSATAKLAGSTSATKQFYTQTGTGSVSAAPAWGTLASGDLSGTYSLGTGYLSGTKTAGSGGVTANLLVKIDSTGNVVLPATSDIGILGVAATTASAAASVEVATRGIVNCVADNTTVIGNVAIVGTTTAGRCRDSGQTNTTLIGPTTQIVGKFLTAVSAGSNASLQLYGPGHYGALFATVATSGLASDLTGTLAAARLPALTGGDATSSAGSANVTVGSIGGKAVTLANSFTAAGNFALTLTQTGTTNVTLPTSGTLIAGGNNFTGANSIAFSSAAGVLNSSSNITWDGVRISALRLALSRDAPTSSSLLWRNAAQTVSYGTIDTDSNGGFLISNLAAAAGTTFQNTTATTGATRVTVSLGAADTAATTTFTNSGTTKSVHYIGGGTAPTVASGFGSSPSIAGTDSGGRVTIGTGGVATTGAVTFGTAYSTAPACTVNDETSVLLIQATATTTTLTLSAATPFGAADKLTWTCVGY